MGSERLPDFADRAQLPYITAVMKEVLRWHPPGPTGTCVLVLSPRQEGVRRLMRSIGVPQESLTCWHKTTYIEDTTCPPEL